MTDIIEAWQCAGCGRIEAPQPCIGVCRDHKIRMVDKDDYELALDQLREAQDRLASATQLLSRLAHSTPREGYWKQSYLTLQALARELLASRSS